ncbi:hypothetical protein ACQ4PT_067787 [Festuca glaucescens]
MSEEAPSQHSSRLPATGGGFADKDGKDTGKLPYGLTGDEVSVTISEAFSSLSDIKSSLKVYTYDELVTATDDFSTDRHIGGSVYRAAFSGDTAAVEIVDHDVSTELEEDGGGDPLACLNALGVDRKNDEEHHGDDGAALKRLEEFVDPAMAAGSCPLDAVVMMVRLIERCVQRNAAPRPGMGEVAQYLLKLSDISGDSWQSSSEYQQSSGSETTSEQLAR